MLKRSQSSALNLMMGTEMNNCDYNKMRSFTVLGISIVEKWRVKLVKLLHLSTDSEFSKNLKSQLEKEKQKQLALKETAANLGNELKALANENKNLAMMHLNKVGNFLFIDTFLMCLHEVLFKIL